MSGRAVRHALNGHPRTCSEDPALRKSREVRSGRHLAEWDTSRPNAGWYARSVDLPFAIVVLQRLFALDRLADVRELLVPDEHVHVIAGTMLLDAKNQPVGDAADVESTSRLAGENVGPVVRMSRTPWV